MSYLQLSEGGFQVVCPLGLWSGSPELSKSDLDMASKLFTFTFTYITGPDPGISARLMYVACMTHMHLTTCSQHVLYVVCMYV